MQIEAGSFHPMRGHVEDGAVVVFSNGSKLTLRSRLTGWALVDEEGRAAGVADGAYDLTVLVLKLEADRADRSA